MTRLMSGPTGGERDAEKDEEVASGGREEVVEGGIDVNVEVEDVVRTRGSAGEGAMEMLVEQDVVGSKTVSSCPLPVLVCSP